jgi:hypothetical protein
MPAAWEERHCWLFMRFQFAAGATAAAWPASEVEISPLPQRLRPRHRLLLVLNSAV